MASLNDTIVAYLTINNIAFGGCDYQTGQTEGEKDQVLHWDTSKLGTQPTQEQLNSAYTIHQANLALAQQAQANAKASAHAKLAALGLTAEEITSLGA
jgi:hypothetical protein